MVGTGFLRVFSSSGFLLLLLFTMATTTTQRADATTSDLTTTDGTGITTTDAPVTGYTTTDASTPTTASDADDDGKICSAEFAACEADATCIICQTAGNDSAQVSECGDFNSLTTSAAGCDANTDSACCLDDASELECLDNDVFLAYWMCILGELGCSSVDEISCDGDVGAGTASDGATGTIAAGGFGHVFTAVVGFSCACMVFWPLLWA